MRRWFNSRHPTLRHRLPVASSLFEARAALAKCGKGGHRRTECPKMLRVATRPLRAAMIRNLLWRLLHLQRIQRVVTETWMWPVDSHHM